MPAWGTALGLNCESVLVNFRPELRLRVGHRPSELRFCLPGKKTRLDTGPEITKIQPPQRDTTTRNSLNSLAMHLVLARFQGKEASGNATTV
jgi:hypothetical protein